MQGSIELKSGLLSVERLLLLVVLLVLVSVAYTLYGWGSDAPTGYALFGGKPDVVDVDGVNVGIAAYGDPPVADEFPPESGSTDFAAVEDFNDVENLTLANDLGEIDFPDDYGVNASGEDYDTHVEIGDGFISVNTTALDETFTAAEAEVTIKSLNCYPTLYYTTGDYASAAEIKANGLVCDRTTNPRCTFKSCDTGAGTVTFTVSHFSGFTGDGDNPFSGGDGSPGDPFQIDSCSQLQDMQYFLASNFTLTDDINCDETTSWNEGAGFDPVGDNTYEFTGSLDGNSKTISSLYIDNSSLDYVGLFGDVDTSASISDVGLENVDITGNRYVGGLVGHSNGDITRSYSTGAVSGGNYVGGLVGVQSTGGKTISDSYSTASVSGNTSVGGLVSTLSASTLTDSYATGTVAGSGQWVGGLVGTNSGTLSNSFSTGGVTGGTTMGGLIGTGYAPTNCYWNNHSGNPDDCYDGGNTNCTAIQDNMNYFKGDVFPGDPPMSSWGFFGTWEERVGDFPSLTWQGVGGSYTRPCPDWLSGGGTAGDPCIITNCTELQDMSLNSSAAFKLSGTIDCADTPNWNGGWGFAPVPLEGSLDGDGNKIWYLTINRPSSENVGLFSRIYEGAEVKDVGLESVDVKGNLYVGGLTGINDGTITRSYVHGNTVNASAVYAGGLAGKNTGTISDCYSYGNVYGYAGYAGGLVGVSSGEITNSYSISNANVDIGYSGAELGGLVAYNSGTISNSFAIGSVYGYDYVGGLVGGRNVDTITNCYWNNHSGNPENCTGGAISNPAGCTAIQDHVAYFKGDVDGRAPTSSWGFFSVWEENEEGYPTLTWEGVGGSYTRPCPEWMSGGGTSEDPCLITNCTELQDMSLNLSAAFELSGAIDCSATTSWNGGDGFQPVGDNTNRFTGSLDGNEWYPINNLYINPDDGAYQGLFGYTDGANIERIRLSNVNITYDVSGNSYAGALVGYNSDTNINDSSSTGSITCTAIGTSRVGGLVGYNYANAGNSDITNSYSTCTVKSNYYGGGLVGYNRASSGVGASITNSYATGSVTILDGGSAFAGGLIGENIGGSGTAVITESYAVGDVYAGALGQAYAGGLIANNNVGTGSASIIDSYATGDATANSTLYDYGTWAGGLVGYNDGGSGSADIENSYATGNVEADFIDQGITGSWAGGLVGHVVLSGGTADIEKSFSTGSVTGDDNVGGLVASPTTATITNCYWNNASTNPPTCTNSSEVSGCTAIQDCTTYFTGDVYPDSEPMSSWSFFSVWEERVDDYPSLTWQAAGESIVYDPCDEADNGSACDTNKDCTNDGVCAYSGSDWECDTDTVFYNGSWYMTSGSSATDGYRCEDGVVGSDGFTQEGLGAGTGETTLCDTSGHVVCPSGTGSDCYMDCAATYDGDPCDDTLTDGDFNTTAVCVDSGGWLCGNTPTIVTYPIGITDDITPSYNTNYTIWCNATISDGDGYTDISSVDAVLWDPGTSTKGSFDIPDNHYTNSSCTETAHNGPLADYACGFTVAWYAPPGEWACNITATDSTGLSGSSERTDLTIIPFDGAVPTTGGGGSEPVSFGDMMPGGVTPQGSYPVMTVENQGNNMIDVSISSTTDLTCDVFGTIADANIHYSISDSTPYASMCELGVYCAETEADFNLRARNSTDTSNPSKNLYFAVQIPTTGAKGSCNTTILATPL